MDENRKVEDDENGGKVSETPKDKGNETKSSTMKKDKSSDESDNRRNTNLKVSQDGKKKQEFFRLELRRIKTGLEKEASKIKRPKERDYYPFVWTSLAPYYDTTTAQYLIPLDNEEDKDKEQKDGKEEVPDEKHIKKRNPEMEKLAYEKSIRAYLTRNTAIGLCDPWVDLNMDKRFLEFPKIETPEEKQKKQADEADKGSSAEKGEKSKKTRPPKEGSTRLPKFPVITLDRKELATKPLHYNDVPMLRSEFEASFSLKSKERMKKDYKRTKEDFYRMELDRLNEIHKRSRPHMRQAYFAYLQNTPGSREAIYDCMVESGFTKKKNTTTEKPRNESPTSQKVEVKAQ
ncbi:hypothetical protein ACJMK2_004656 [Sinanodonta woodiana]|uniref:Uncharacterized protein n=1 Tax=Sinanodonta woodiana TaxID=1069815 RepID=A0ABD3Y2V6_SINWO